MTPIATPGLHKNLNAFLMLLTKTEGTDKYGKPYNTIYSYKEFTDFSKHPNIRIPFVNPKTNKNDFSTAAGRYQINYPTYKMLGMTSFTPEAQDAGAIELIKRSGAYGDVIKGNFETAINKTNRVWASLPGSDSKQRQFTMLAAMNFIKQYAGATLSVGLIITLSIVFYLLIHKS